MFSFHPVLHGETACPANVWLTLTHMHILDLQSYKCDSLCLLVIQPHLAVLGHPNRTQKVKEVMCLSALCLRSDPNLPCCQFLLEAHEAPEKDEQDP